MRKVLSVWKVILIILASFVGVGGATALGLYLTGSFNNVVVQPEDMQFSHDVDGEGFYNVDKATFEISADSKLTLVCTTEKLTEKEVTLSLRNGEERNGFITDGVISIPKIVELNKPFEVQVVRSYNEDIYQNWVHGGTSYITAKSSNVNLTSRVATISVDVPVYGIDLAVSGTEKTAEEKASKTQRVVVDSVFTLDTTFVPNDSKYAYGDSDRERGIFFSITGTNSIAYDETTKSFTALRVSDGSEENIVTAYVFANAFYEKNFFDQHPNATTDTIVSYLSSKVGTEAVSARLNLVVESVDVQEVDFTLTGSDILGYVDKEYMITTNSANGDKNLGIVVKDADDNILTELYGQVGIKIPQGVENFRILGGKIAVVTENEIWYEEYNPSKNYFEAPDGTAYYLLPNVAPSNPNNYYWLLSATDDVDSTKMYVNFFFEKDGVKTKFFDDETEENKFFTISFAKHADLAVGWIEPEKTIDLKINYNAGGEAVPASTDLSRLIKQVDVSNVYQTIKYFLFAEDNATDLTEAFVCEVGKLYTEDYKGEKFAVDNELSTRESYMLFEIKGSTLTAKRSFNGKVKIIAAIIRTDINGSPYNDADGKYLIVAAGRSKEIVVESSLSIANMEAAYSFVDGVEPSEDGKYYIPSVRKTGENADEALVKLKFVLSSDDIENDVNKIPTAFTNNKLRVVCLSNSGEVNETQFLSLVSLVEDENARTASSAIFEGTFVVNGDALSQITSDGEAIKLQLQYEEFSKAIFREGTEEEDTFYIYKQIPATMKGKYEEYKDEYEEPLYPANALIDVELKTSGVTITWGENEIEGTQEVSALQRLQSMFEYAITDQKGKDIRSQDGMYKIYFAELNDDGSVKTSNNILTFNSNSTALRNFAPVNGNTKMQIYVRDQNNNNLLSSPIFNFHVVSEGLQTIRIDSTTKPHDQQTPSAEDDNPDDGDYGDYWEYNSSKWTTESTGVTQTLGEITTRKLVTKESVINVDYLFKVYTSGTTESGVDINSYRVTLDATFVGGFRGKTSSKDLMKMMRFNDVPSMEDTAIEDYYDGVKEYEDSETHEIKKLPQDIRKITIVAPFGRQVTLVFNIVDKTGLYNITLNIILLSDIRASNGFISYMQDENATYHDYYKQSQENPNAISVLAGRQYDLDEYLSFAQGSGYSWASAKLTNETFEETSGVVTCVPNSGKIQIADVYQDTNVTFTVHYISPSSYAYSISISLYIIPNFKLVQTNSAFIDLSEIVQGMDIYVSDFFTISRIDNSATAALPTLANFTYSNMAQGKYLTIDAEGKFKFIQTATTFEYEFDRNYDQVFAIHYSQNGNDIIVDAAIQNGADVVVKQKGQTTIDFTIGYYSANPKDMIQAIVPGAKIIRYNGELRLLLLTDCTYKLSDNFTIAETSGMYIGHNSRAIQTRGSVEGFFYDEEYVIVQKTLSDGGLQASGLVLRMRLNVVITSIGEVFAYYSDDPADFAEKIGAYTGLQDADIEQELTAGSSYEIVHLRNYVNYDKTTDTEIDWSKTYYYCYDGHKLSEVVFYYDIDGVKTATATEVTGISTYYICNEEYETNIQESNKTYSVVEAATLSTFYECLYDYDANADYGFFIDADRYVRNDYYRFSVEIVENAAGYVAGLAQLNVDNQNRNILVLSDLSEGQTDVYVVLKFTMIDTQTGLEFAWYYRIHVKGNFAVGEVYYPYAAAGEYLETTSEYYNEVARERGVVDPQGDYVNKFYEINLEEEFDDKTLVANKKRFEFNEIDVTSKTEVYSVSIVRENISTLLTPTEYSKDGVSYLVYGQNLMINIDGNILKVYLKDDTEKYTIKLKRSYYDANNSEMIGSELYYTFLITQAPTYYFETSRLLRYEQVKFYYLDNQEYKVANGTEAAGTEYYVKLQNGNIYSKVNAYILQRNFYEYDDDYALTEDSEIDWTKTYYEKFNQNLVPTGNVFTLNAVAGEEEITLDTRLYVRNGSSDTPINNYGVYIVGEDNLINNDSFTFDKTTHQIKFTPRASIERNDSFEIGIFEVDFDETNGMVAKNTSLVAFRIVVNVESFYKYQILTTEVDSGDETRFEELFYIYDSAELYSLTEDETIDWSKAYYERVSENNYEQLRFYYEDQGIKIETTTPVTGKTIYTKFSSDADYSIVNNSWGRIYEYHRDLSNGAEITINNAAEVYGYIKTSDNAAQYDVTNDKWKTYYLLKDGEFVEIDKVYYAVYIEVTDQVDEVRAFFVKDGENYTEVTAEYIQANLFEKQNEEYVQSTDQTINRTKTYYDATHNVVTFYCFTHKYVVEPEAGVETYCYKVGENEFVNFDEAGMRQLYELITIGDIASADNTNKSISHAYLDRDITLELTANYGGFKFDFDLTLLARNPYNSTTFTDEIIRYGKVNYNLTINHLKDHAQNRTGMLDDASSYKFVITNDNEVTLLDGVEINPRDYSENHIETERYKIAYLFEGRYIRDFSIEYRYEIRPNVDVVVNYPDPDGNRSVATEYYQNGVSGQISFSENALFSNKPRIEIADLAQAYVLVTESTIKTLFEHVGDDYLHTSDTTINWTKTYYYDALGQRSVTFYYYQDTHYAATNVAIADVSEYYIVQTQIVEKDWKVEIVNIADVSVIVGGVSYTELSGNEIDGETEFSLVLNAGRTSGTVRFKITINEAIVYYTFNIINQEVFTTETNETNYTLVDQSQRAEFIYAEDLVDYTSQDLFENDRILGYAFNSNAVLGNNYYVRLTKKNDTAYKIVKITATALAGRLNTDIGSQATDYVFTKAYTTLAYAQAGGNEGNAGDIFSTTPFVTSRIVFKYGVGTATTEIKNSSAWVGKESTQFTGLTGNDYKNSTDTLGYTIKLLVDGNSEPIGVSSKTYSLYLTSELVVNGNANSKTSYVIAEVDAGSSVSLLSDLAAYGIVNSRLGVAYNENIMAQSKGNLDLDIYGFAELPVPTTDDESDLYWFYRQYGLVPRAGGFVINNPKGSDDKYNYVTLSGKREGGQSTGKLLDFYILAQGAKNEGDYIMMRLTYSVAFAEQTIEDYYNLLLKINPATEVYFNGTNYSAGTETIDGNVWATNKRTPLVVVNDNLKQQNELMLCATDPTDTNPAHNAVVVRLYGNTGAVYNNLKLNDYGFELNYVSGKVTYDGVEYNEYNSKDSVTTHITNDYKFIMPRLQIGKKYYYINMQNEFNYKIRLYVTLEGSVLPTLEIKDTLFEGDKIYFGADHSVVTTPEMKYDGISYQPFTNAVKKGVGNAQDEPAQMTFKPTDAMSFKIGNEAIDNEKILMVVTNASGLYVNSQPYTGDIYKTGANDLTDATWTTQEHTQLIYDQDGHVFKLNADMTYNFKFGLQFDCSDGINDVKWTKAGQEYVLYPNYSLVDSNENEKPESKVKGEGQVLAKVGGISAYGFAKEMKLISKEGLQRSGYTSMLPKFNVVKVEFKLNGEPLYTASARTSEYEAKIVGNKKIFSTNSVKYVISSTEDPEDGTQYNENDCWQIPHIDGFYYGQGNTLPGVTMVVTLKDDQDNIGTIESTITLKHKASLGSGIISEAVLDGEFPTITPVTSGDGVNRVVNNTLQIELDKGASVTFALKYDVMGNLTTITNDKPYKTTKYINIVEHLNGLTTYFAGGHSIATIVTKNSGATIKYNDEIVVQHGMTTTAEGNIFKMHEQGSDDSISLTLHIDDSSEVASAAGFVSRELYFMYTYRYGIFQYLYQAQPVVVKVYPQYSGAYTDSTDPQGRYRITEVRYWSIDDVQNEPQGHYVVPVYFWAESVLLEGSLSSIYFEDPQKFIFEVNQSVDGGAGAGYIDEQGNIILYPSFTIGTDTITINVYLKPTTANNDYGCYSGWLLGQFRISLGTEVYTSGDFFLGQQGVPEADGTYGDNFAEKVNEEFEIADLLGEEKNSNIHYHVLSDEYTSVGGTSSTTTQYRYDNRDRWKFTTIGTHTLTIAKTENCSIIETKTMTIYVYDESVGQEEVVLMQGPEIYLDETATQMLNMDLLYEAAKTTDGSVNMEKAYYVASGTNMNRQAIYTYNFELTQNPSGLNYYFRVTNSNNVPSYIPISTNWIQHNLYEANNTEQHSDDTALNSTTTYYYKTSSGVLAVATFYAKTYVDVVGKVGVAYLHVEEFTEISANDPHAYADTYYYKNLKVEGLYSDTAGTPVTSADFNPAATYYKYENGEYVVETNLYAHVKVEYKVVDAQKLAALYVYDDDSESATYEQYIHPASINPKKIYYADVAGTTKVEIYYARYAGTEDLTLADYFTNTTAMTKVDMSALYEITKTSDTYVNWKKCYYTKDNDNRYNRAIFYDDAHGAHEYNETTGYAPINVTYDINGRFVIEGNLLKGNPTFSNSGRYERQVINKNNGAFIKYTFYVYSDEVAVEYRKTSNEEFAMSNLSTDVTAFWRIETEAAALDKASVTLTRITKENTANRDMTIRYLALKTDGTYKIYSVRYIVVGNLSGAFGTIDKDESVVATIKDIFGNPDELVEPNYIIYRVGKNGLIEDVSTSNDNVQEMLARKFREENPAAGAEEINALVEAEMNRTNLFENEFIIIYNNKTYRIRYSLYYYTSAETLNYITTEDAAFVLSGLNSEVLAKVGKAGRVNYYKLDTTNGTLQEVLTITLDNLSSRAKTENYYIKVTTTEGKEYYYIFDVNFFGVSQTTSFIYMTNGGANYNLSNFDVMIKGAFGLANGATLKYYSTENPLIPGVDGSTIYYEFDTITTDNIIYTDTEMTKVYYVEDATSHTYYKVTIQFVKEELEAWTMINVEISTGSNYRLANLTSYLRMEFGQNCTIEYFKMNQSFDETTGKFVDNNTLSKIETIATTDGKVVLYIKIKYQDSNNNTLYTWRKVNVVSTEDAEIIDDEDEEFEGEVRVEQVVAGDGQFDFTEENFVEKVKAAILAADGKAATSLGFYSMDQETMVLVPFTTKELVGVTTSGINKAYYVKITYEQGEEVIEKWYTCRITFKLSA